MQLESDLYPLRSNEPDMRLDVLKFVGGTAAITQTRGKAIVATYISTGVVELTFPDGPQNYVGLAGFGFEATVPAQVAGYTCNTNVYNTATKKLRVYIYANSAGVPTLTDLAALQWLTLNIERKSVT